MFVDIDIISRQKALGSVKFVACFANRFEYLAIGHERREMRSFDCGFPLDDDQQSSGLQVRAEVFQKGYRPFEHVQYIHHDDHVEVLLGEEWILDLAHNDLDIPKTFPGGALPDHIEARGRDVVCEDDPLGTNSSGEGKREVTLTGTGFANPHSRFDPDGVQNLLWRLPGLPVNLAEARDRCRGQDGGGKKYSNVNPTVRIEIFEMVHLPVPSLTFTAKQSPGNSAQWKALS